MMISFEEEDKKFQCRAASIILHGNKVLFQRGLGNKIWFIPGGRIEFNETAEQTIERELLEEFNVTVVEKKLIWLVENFVRFPDKQVHEVAWFFLVKLDHDDSIFTHEDEFIGVEPEFINKWIHMDDLDKYNIVPEFVVPELKKLEITHGIKHIVSKGLR
jgi:8-oxo-dGTP pyrophosphatase MutT (NUDIX family)